MSRKSKNRDIDSLPLDKWEAELRKWCHANGAELKITNAGHHWQIRAGLRLFADWWPAGGKLQVNGKHYKHYTAMDASGVIPRLVAGLLEATLPDSPFETAPADTAHLTTKFIDTCSGGPIQREKPPHGVMPRRLWMEHRAAELSQAIEACIADELYKPSVVECCDELAELVLVLEQKDTDERD